MTQKKKRIPLAFVSSDDKAKTKTIRKLARVVGSFAVWQDGDLYNISHVPTGRKLFLCYSEEDALKAVAFMSDGLDWDWGEFGEIASRRAKHYRRAKQAYAKYGTNEISL